MATYQYCMNCSFEEILKIIRKYDRPYYDYIVSFSNWVFGIPERMYAKSLLDKNIKKEDLV